jgi:phosphonate transport system permease protein
MIATPTESIRPEAPPRSDLSLVTVATQGDSPHGRRTVRAGRGWLLLVAIAVAASWVAAVGPTGGLNTAGWALVERFFGAAREPRLDHEFLGVVADAMVTTVAFALAGTALSLAIGVVVGVLSSETWWRPDRDHRVRRAHTTRRIAAWWSIRAVSAVPRGVHEAIVGLMLLRVLGLDPWVAVLAIGVPNGAVAAKVFAELIDDADDGVRRSLRAAGAGRVAALAYGVVPSIAPGLVSHGAYRFECAIRSSVVLGMIGAGGLGYQIAVSFQSLRYHDIWTLIAAVWLLSLSAEALGAALRRRIAGPEARTFTLTGAALTALAVVGACAHLGLDPRRLVDADAGDNVARLAGEAWPPELPDAGWSALLRASVDTVQLSLIAISSSALLALPIATIAARVRRRRRHGLAAVDTAGRCRAAVGFVARGVLLTMRCIPPPMWALLVLFIVRPGPLAGGLALGAYTLGVLGRLDAEAIEDADRSTFEHLRASGAPALAAAFYGTVPAVGRTCAALATYRWEVAARDSILVGLVGAGGLGRLYADQRVAFDESAMSTTIAAMIVVAFAIDIVSVRVRLALR